MQGRWRGRLNDRSTIARRSLERRRAALDAGYTRPELRFRSSARWLYGSARDGDPAPGPLEIVQDGQKLQLPSGLPRALLTLLALTPGEALRTERIVDLLWGDSPPPSAVGVVQTYVSRLRKVLGDEAIRTVGSGYALELDAGERDVDAVVRLRAEAKDQPPRAGASHVARGSRDVPGNAPRGRGRARVRAGGAEAAGRASLSTRG